MFVWKPIKSMAVTESYYGTLLYFNPCGQKQLKKIHDERVMAVTEEHFSKQTFKIPDIIDTIVNGRSVAWTK